jgi:hypothetical protein
MYIYIYIYIFFFRENDYLYAIIIDVFKLEVLVPYHHDFIGNFMIYLAGFSKKEKNVSTICLLKIINFFK